MGTILVLSGCASVGNDARILPIPNDNWKYSSEDYFRDNMVKYDCSDFNIKVYGVPVRSKTYLVGPLLPLLPVFYGTDDSKDDPGLKIEVETTNGIELTNDEVSTIIISDKEGKVHPGSIYKSFIIRAGVKHYIVEFDMPRDGTAQFQMIYSQQLRHCFVLPLQFKLSDETGFRLWTPGP